MQSEGSVPCLQGPSSGSYPDKYQSSSCNLHATYLHSILTLSSHLSLDLSSGLFPSGLHIKTLYTLFFFLMRHHVFRYGPP
jgi:hypothetical protein